MNINTQMTTYRDGTAAIAKTKRYILFATPDGDGEAVKLGADQSWLVNLPTGSFTFFGSSAEVQSEITKVMRCHYEPNN